MNPSSQDEQLSFQLICYNPWLYKRKFLKCLDNANLNLGKRFFILFDLVFLAHHSNEEPS